MFRRLPRAQASGLRDIQILYRPTDETLETYQGVDSQTHKLHFDRHETSKVIVILNLCMCVKSQNSRFST